MAEEPKAQAAGATQEPPPAPVTTTGKTETPPPQSPAASTEEPFDRERALSTIRAQREAERELKAQLKTTREELEQLTAERKKAEEAKLSETERLQRRLQEGEETAKRLLADFEAKVAEAEAKRIQAEGELAAERRIIKVAQAAQTLGALDPYDANIRAATATISVDNPKADELVKAAIETLKKAKPYLFARTPGTVEPFNPGQGSGVSETDAQRLMRLRRQTGQMNSPIG